MVKELLIASVCATILLGSSCSSSRSVQKGDDADLGESRESAPGDGSGAAHRAWTRKSGGIVIELSAATRASENSAWVLASLIPDLDNGGSARKNQILGLGDRGKVLWRKDTKTAVKSQALAQDGSLGVYSTYDDRVTAVAHNGEVRWSADAVCRPLPVARTHAVLCFHDDDAEPETAFEMLDWKTGAKLASYPVRDDVLNLKLSQDERHFAISFSGGRVMLFELIEPKPGFKQVWDRKFRSEVLDLSVSSGLVGVLTADQKLQLLDFAGKTRAEAALGARVEQIELAPQGGGVMAFDNSARGQTLMYFDLPADLPSDTLKLEEKWRKQDPEPSNYTAPLLVSEGQVMLRFESSDERSMKSRLFSFSADGHAAWSLPLEHGEGSQLYAQTRIGDTDWVYVATDDGEIRAYAPARRGDGAGK